MNWYAEEVKELIKKRDQLLYKPLTVFYGSSSIRMWDSLYEDFKDFLPLNLGFGGSTLEACVYYFDWLVAPVKSGRKLIVYAGDNDLGDGKTAEETFHFFTQLEAMIQQQLPTVPWYYISIKPSISRWNINDNIKHFNQLTSQHIRSNSKAKFINIYDAMLNKDSYPNADYYDGDGLHLSAAGYKVWRNILLAQVFAEK